MSKPPMDDLATLFIGNNLQLANTQPPPEEFSFERRSNILTPNLVGMLAFLGEYTPQFVSGWTPPDAASGFSGPDSAFGYDSTSPNGYMSGPNGYGGMTPTGYNGMPAVAVGPQRPYDLGIGHPLHYAQFIAPEAGVFQRPVYSVPTFTPPPMSQLEVNMWPEAPKSKSKARGKGARNSRAGAEALGHAGSAGESGDTKDGGPRAKAARRTPKTSLKGTRAPKISIDYSPEAVTRLLDLQPEEGMPVLSGFLHGRLFTNDQDNFNYMTVVAGEPDVSRKYKPLMVACYRRNFISIYLRVGAPPKVLLLLLLLLPSHYRLEILASVIGDDPEPVSFFVAKAKSDTAKSNALEPLSIGESHVFVPPADGGEMYFTVKKLQFKNATANNINLNFQTYYRLRARLYGGADASAPMVASVTSCPIVVRGRNPSFYEDRRDVLISGRAPALRDSYVVDNSSDNVLVPVLVPVLEPTKLPKEEDDDEGPEKETNDVAALEPASGRGCHRRGRYHYFPMLNVYYTPPINVVYFPHGAHQAQTDRSALRGAPLLDSGRREPQVYFR